MYECTFHPNLKPNVVRKNKSPIKATPPKSNINPTIDQFTPIDRKNITDSFNDE